MITLKGYQIEDIARLSLTNGAILGWACGLGKTPATYIWILLKCGFSKYTLDGGVWRQQLKIKAPALIISPEDLHRQTAADGKKFFDIDTYPAAGLDYSEPVPNGIYITSYTALERLNIPPEAFTCIVVDEGDKTKKSSSVSGLAVRRLKPRYRLIATATPLADRLQDLFWLCSWVCENDPKGARRWPWCPNESQYRQFRDRYGCGDSAEVSNLLELWRTLGPIVLRRTVDETGEKVVGLTHQIVRCRLGTEQKDDYQRALFDPNVDIGVRLGSLRLIAGGAGWPNPKIATALELIANVMGRGEQVLVASDFRGPNDSLAGQLRDAGIPHVLMDGRMNPHDRALFAERFKAGDIPIALIGLKSGAEGMSYPKCNNVIILNYSWEYKKLPQVIHRARRINSERDLEVFSLVSEGTIEERMAELVVAEKGGAADLVLDGVWPSAGGASESWIETAAKEFKADRPTIDERELDDQWPGLKARLQSTYSASIERSSPCPRGSRSALNTFRRQQSLVVV